MKRTFLLMTLFITTMTISAQHNMQIWNGNTYTEYSTANIDSITFLTAPNGTRTPVVVYDTITKYFEVYTDENGSKDTVEVLPHYIGYSNEVIEFWSTTLSDDEKAKKLLALANLETKTNKISTGSYDKTASYDVDKFKILQLIVAIPKAYFSNITDDVYFSIKDNTFQSEWYDIDGKTNTHSLNEITMHGITYIVWTMYNKLGNNFNGTTYTITYK